MIILPHYTTDEAMEAFAKQSGMKRGVDFDRSEMMPMQTPEKALVTLGDLMNGNRKGRRHAEAVMRKMQ
jgi:hypothetical protein